MMRNDRALARLRMLSTVLVLVVAAPASAATPFPVGPPNQPATYGDCVSTTAAGEGVEDYTVGVQTFTQLVGPTTGQRTDVETLACKGFSPPPGPQG